jgi:hypothetical protein
MIATKGPVIDTRHGQGIRSRTGTAAHHSKKRIVAHGHHEPRRESRRRASSQSKAEMMDEALQPGGSSRPGNEIGLVESLGEDASGAPWRLATKTARQDLKMDGASRTGKVRDLPDIAAWTRREGKPHEEGAAASAWAPTVRWIASLMHASLSTTRPCGTRDIVRCPKRILLVPPGK